MRFDQRHAAIFKVILAFFEFMVKLIAYSADSFDVIRACLQER